MKTLATITRSAALTLILIVAAFLFPLQLTGQNRLNAAKPAQFEFSVQNFIIDSEIRPLQVSVLTSFARLFLPITLDYNVRLYSLSPAALAPDAIFCREINPEYNTRHTNFLKNSTDASSRPITVPEQANFAKAVATAEPLERVENWMLSSADWNETLTEIAYQVESWMIHETWIETEVESVERVESWMLNPSTWTEAIAEQAENTMSVAASLTDVTFEPLEYLESWMLSDVTWNTESLEVSQSIESWMSDDTTWASGDLTSEEAQNIESWMLNTESWNVQLTAGIK